MDSRAGDCGPQRERRAVCAAPVVGGSVAGERERQSKPIRSRLERPQSNQAAPKVAFCSRPLGAGCHSRRSLGSQRCWPDANAASSGHLAALAEFRVAGGGALQAGARCAAREYPSART